MGRSSLIVSFVLLGLVFWFPSVPSVEAIYPSVVPLDPDNGSTEVNLTPTCSVEISGPDGMRIRWYYWNGAAWVLDQDNPGTVSGSYSWLYDQATENGTKYYWMVNVTSGTDSTVRIYEFTTSEGEVEEFDLMDAIDSILAFLIVVALVVLAVAFFGGTVSMTRWLRT